MLGKLEYIILGFEGNKFNGKIMPELLKLQKRGIVSIIDFVLLLKDKDGSVIATEVSDLPKETAKALGVLPGSLLNLFSQEDVDEAARALPVNSSAALILFEHKWSLKFKKEVLASGGMLLADETVPEDSGGGA